MNGYSRISNDSSHKSRSMDFSDARSPIHESPKASSKSGAVKAEVEERNKGQRFGVILGRSASVSCSASSASGFQVTMKRAFSMRRSSSVSERYCRIHDQYTAITSPNSNGGHHHQMDTTRSNKKQRAAKILKACKRLLRL